ncbi:hypothetical protein HanPI659440_Chr15g0609241 [Helianthus annuus]|nr:hypothetical protein HanPI659440_Chr15g0609241 [Helianthus annuus]
MNLIVAFPNIDLTLYSINMFSKRSSLKDDVESFDKPHLWYSTSGVICALKLFIKGGNLSSLCGNSDENASEHDFLRTKVALVLLITPSTKHLLSLKVWLTCN